MNKVDWWESWLMEKLNDEKVDWYYKWTNGWTMVTLESLRNWEFIKYTHAFTFTNAWSRSGKSKVLVGWTWILFDELTDKLPPKEVGGILNECVLIIWSSVEHILICDIDNIL